MQTRPWLRFFCLLLMQLLMFSVAKGSFAQPAVLKFTSRANNVCENSLDEFVPNPNDCSKFYFCSKNGSGAGAEAECPHGMLFNKESKLCDQEANVECVVKPKPDNSETDAVQRYCATKAIQQSGRIEYVSSASSCRHYYSCYYGQAIRQQCSANLHWNANTMKCDFVENARCRDDSGGVASSYTNKGHLISCPAYGQHIFPYMRRCDFFVYCVKGHAILQQCPFYHEFDMESKTCKLRKVARCVTEFLR